MNEAAKLIAESISGTNFKTVIIGKDAYSIYPPTIKVICRALPEFARIELEDSYSELSIIQEIPRNAPHVVKGLSVLIVGDVNNWRWKAYKVKQALESATPKELSEAMKSAIDLINGADFFACASLAMNAAKMEAIQK